MYQGLSKSRFLSGLQCHKQLWWRVHEGRSPELEVDLVQQAVLDMGTEVGVRARGYVPGGVLIPGATASIEERLAATRAALAWGATVLYEAAFEADGVFVAVDILQKEPDGWRLIEVKATTSVKEQHLPDVALQLQVLRQSGLPVKAAEVMHLNADCRYPDLSNLFRREDVTADAEELLPTLPAAIGAQKQMLAGPLPGVAAGPHCTKPYPCPYFERCAQKAPRHSVNTLYGISGKRLSEFADQGLSTLFDLPDGTELRPIQARQWRAVKENRLVLEDGLAAALEAFRPPVAFLDFETVAPAIPVWSGCHPFEAVPVQFSCHMVSADGDVRHFQWMAETGDDSRLAFAAALLEATEGSYPVVAYNASFEGRCLEALASAVPSRAAALRALAARLKDLLPVMREHVYHPDFLGHFGLKAVLPALVPELDYSDLEIAGGSLASAQLARLLFRGDSVPEPEREQLRRALFLYCHRDTWGLLRLLERLRAEVGLAPLVSSSSV